MTDVERIERGPTMEERVRSVLEGSEERAGAFLRQQWLTLSMHALSGARRKAKLTQADVAKKMGTTQSAIARMERDVEGGVSLRRYVDYALACGVLPLIPEFKTLDELREIGLSNLRVPALVSAGRVEQSESDEETKHTGTNGSLRWPHRGCNAPRRFAGRGGGPSPIVQGAELASLGPVDATPIKPKPEDHGSGSGWVPIGVEPYAEAKSRSGRAKSERELVTAG